MMNQKEQKVLRSKVAEKIADTFRIENYEFIGYTSEGAVFQNDNEDTFVIRCIVKKDPADVAEQIEDFAKKLEKAEKAKKEKEGE